MDKSLRLELQDALEPLVVHQAAGMVTVQLGVSITEAFARLRNHARTTEKPLAAVSRDIVTNVLDLSEYPDGT